MIEDARVLQEEFIPAEIKHRDAETSHLSDALNPLTRDERGEKAFLYGPSGAGKTCVAKFTVNLDANPKSKRRVSLSHVHGDIIQPVMDSYSLGAIVILKSLY